MQMTVVTAQLGTWPRPRRHYTAAPAERKLNIIFKIRCHQYIYLLPVDLADRVPVCKAGARDLKGYCHGDFAVFRLVQG